MNPYLLHHLLADSAQRFSDRNAIVLKDRAMTYGELHQRSSRISSALIDMGVAPGDRVGIFMNKSIESLVFLFGILKAGAAYVPIDYLAPLNRIEYIIKNCEIRIMFTTRDGARKLFPFFETSSSLDKIVVSGTDAGVSLDQHKCLEVLRADELLSEGECRLGRFDISDSNPAYILHTSGSTGMPKGVGLSHLNSLTFVKMAADFFQIEKEDRLACHAPLQFDLTVFDIFVAVGKGATIMLVPENLSVFPMKLAQFMDEERITVWNSVASVLSLLAEHGRMERFRFDSLKTVIFSGDILPVKYLRKLKNTMSKARFYNVYGQTEANSSTYYQVTGIPEDEGWRIPIGKPFPNFEVFALGDDNEIVKRPGQIGELYVRSSSVAVGYWNDEGKTSEAFVTDPGSCLANRKVYKTGDLVTLDENKDYLFLGRKDQQVKCRGYRIQLNEIETVLNNHPAIKEAVVVAIPDELVGNRIISHVSTINGIEVTEHELFNYCNKTLPMYMLPEKIIFHEKLPKTPTGKTDRKMLREQSQRVP
jgi:amino acid adenylation domain-containing protein